jgi:hypothetical protein
MSEFTEMTEGLLELRGLEGNASDLTTNPSVALEFDTAGKPILSGGAPNSRVTGSSNWGLYYDSKGLLTTGTGHLVKDGDDVNSFMQMTEEQANVLFLGDVNEREPEIKNAFSGWSGFHEDTRTQIRNAWFRGSMGGSPETRRLINSGQFLDAADEFLDSDEYRGLLESNPSSGIISRMEAVYDALENEGIFGFGDSDDEPPSVQENVLAQPLPDDYIQSIHQDLFNQKVTKIKEAPNTIDGASKITKRITNFDKLIQSSGEVRQSTERLTPDKVSRLAELRARYPNAGVK